MFTPEFKEEMPVGRAATRGDDKGPSTPTAEGTGTETGGETGNSVDGEVAIGLAGKLTIGLAGEVQCIFMAFDCTEKLQILYMHIHMYKQKTLQV